MNEAVLFVILAPICAVGGWAMVFAAARIETRRRDFLAKRFAAPPLTSNEQGAIGEMASPRNRTTALGGSSACHTALRGLLKSMPAGQGVTLP
jgi:hypothetical protein